MRSLPIVVSVVVLCTLAVGVACAETVTYPIEVQVNTISPSRQVSEVYVLRPSGPPIELSEFMEQTVPDALRTTTNLPPASTDPTLKTDVTIPLRSPAYIYNKGKLPVWLRVRATQTQNDRIREDRHERFKGTLNDPWTIQSYFITQFTADCRVTKYHTTETFTYRKPATGVREVFNWVDP